MQVALIVSVAAISLLCSSCRADGHLDQEFWRAFDELCETSHAQLHSIEQSDAVSKLREQPIAANFLAAFDPVSKSHREYASALAELDIAGIDSEIVGLLKSLQEISNAMADNAEAQILAWTRINEFTPEVWTEKVKVRYDSKIQDVTRKLNETDCATWALEGNEHGTALLKVGCLAAQSDYRVEIDNLQRMRALALSQVPSSFATELSKLQENRATLAEQYQELAAKAERLEEDIPHTAINLALS